MGARIDVGLNKHYLLNYAGRCYVGRTVLAMMETVVPAAIREPQHRLLFDTYVLARGQMGCKARIRMLWHIYSQVRRDRNMALLEFTIRRGTPRNKIRRYEYGIRVIRELGQN